MPTLTPRERQIGCLIAKGLRDKEIAVELVITHKTVRAHVHNLYTKLRMHNRVAVAIHFHEEMKRKPRAQARLARYKEERTK